jgi:hypothetical protein
MPNPMKPKIFILVGILWISVGFIFWEGWAHVRKTPWDPARQDPKTIAKVFFGCGGLFFALGVYGLRNSNN